MRTNAYCDVRGLKHWKVIHAVTKRNDFYVTTHAGFEETPDPVKASAFVMLARDHVKAATFDYSQPCFLQF